MGGGRTKRGATTKRKGEQERRGRRRRTKCVEDETQRRGERSQGRVTKKIAKEEKGPARRNARGGRG
jgi:hypothetical protein